MPRLHLVRIALNEAYSGRIDTEFLRHRLRENGFMSLAVILVADKDCCRSVRRHFKFRCLTIAGANAFDVTRKTEPAELAGQFRFLASGVERRGRRMCGNFIQEFREIAGIVCPIHRGRER